MKNKSVRNPFCVLGQKVGFFTLSALACSPRMRANHGGMTTDLVAVFSSVISLESET